MASSEHLLQPYNEKEAREIFKVQITAQEYRTKAITCEHSNILLPSLASVKLIYFALMEANCWKRILFSWFTCSFLNFYMCRAIKSKTIKCVWRETFAFGLYPQSVATSAHLIGDWGNPVLFLRERLFPFLLISYCCDGKWHWFDRGKEMLVRLREKSEISKKYK